MTDKQKPPMVVWLDVDGTSSSENGRVNWGNWIDQPQPCDHGPYVHLDQFVAEVEARSTDDKYRHMHPSTQMAEALYAVIKELKDKQ